MAHRIDRTTTGTTENVTGIGHCAADVLQPESVAEVQAIVQAARRDGVPLYPVSTGFNWGYGSSSPVAAGNRLVNLSRMNRIRNADAISLDNPVAVIEPGVTQGQLHAFLQEHCPELGFNVTGSSTETSLLGCALDRGVGYFGPRSDDVFGLEVVLGTGELLHTGFRRLGEHSPLAHAHPHGLGPMLDGLFFQGNFGIVTSACITLRPRRPREVAVSLSLRNPDDLGELVGVLARLKRDGVLTSVTHVGNKARNRATLTYGIVQYLERHCGFTPEKAASEASSILERIAPNEWSSLAAVTGNAGQVRAALKEIRRRTRGLARMLVVTEGRLKAGHAVFHPLRRMPFARANAAAIHAIRPLHGLALGHPTNVPIQNLLWSVGHSSEDPRDLDGSRCGLLYISPALPLDGRLVAETIRRLETVAAGHGHDLAITLNVETGTSLVAIINLVFDRDDEQQVTRAHACADALLTEIQARGLSPYRARVDMMAALVTADAPHWQQVRALKTALDPGNIIAPGQYNLP